MNTASNANSRIDFIALSLLITLSVALGFLAYQFGGMDFGVYYAAGKVFLQGGNPYDYQQLSGQIISSTGKLNNPYYYAPWFTWTVSLFALLPFKAARFLWAVINFVLWFWGLHNLSKIIPWPISGFRRWGVYLYVTFVFAWVTWGSEQVGILIFFLLTLMLMSCKNENWLSMGTWMALLLFKPNITAFPLLAICVWLILHRIWKPVVIMIGLLAIMIITSLLISPGWYLELLQPDKITGLSYTLSEAGAAQVVRYKTTLLNWLAVYGVIENAAYIIYMVAVVLGLFALGRTIFLADSIIELTALAFLVNFALTPYALFYDYPPLVVLFFSLNFELAARTALVWLQRSMNLLIIAILFVGDNIAYRYWIVVVLTLALLVKNIYINASPRRAGLPS